MAINVVTDFGADNTGIKSCFTALQNALNQAFTNGGGEIYFPQGTYRISADTPNIKPLFPGSGTTHYSLNNVRLFGEGAKIICDATLDDTNVNGSGGGFSLSGDSIIIEGLRFEGYAATARTDKTKNNGRLLKLSGNKCVVKNCYFKEGNGGAVEFAGSHNIVKENVFENCNYFNKDHYGAIHVTGDAGLPSKYNTISENKIFGQYHSGISAYGSYSPAPLGVAPDNVSCLDIVNNYIRSASSNRTNDSSMGIYLDNGANQNIKIIGNTIEEVDAEGIEISSHPDYPSSKCIIANNIIRNCDYRGIALDSKGEGGTFTDYAICANIIENTPSTPHYDDHIWLDRVESSVISNNQCIGWKDVSPDPKTPDTYRGIGIAFSHSCPGNQVSNNILRTFETGIAFYSPKGILTGNIVSDCTTGIVIAWCKGANISGNIITSCTLNPKNPGVAVGVGIRYGPDAPAQLIANSITDCNHTYSSDPPIAQLLTLSGLASGGSYTNLYVTDKLSGGVKTVTFHNVYKGDRFLVVPNNESGDTPGALYVSLIDPDRNQVTVRSTLSTDSRYFTLLKLFSSGPTY